MNEHCSSCAHKLRLTVGSTFHCHMFRVVPEFECQIHELPGIPRPKPRAYRQASLMSMALMGALLSVTTNPRKREAEPPSDPTKDIA